MAPEHLEALIEREAGRIDHRADLYSLGLVLLEAVGFRTYRPGRRDAKGRGSPVPVSGGQAIGPARDPRGRPIDPPGLPGRAAALPGPRPRRPLRLGGRAGGRPASRGRCRSAAVHPRADGQPDGRLGPSQPAADGRRDPDPRDLARVHEPPRSRRRPIASAETSEVRHLFALGRQWLEVGDCARAAIQFKTAAEQAEGWPGLRDLRRCRARVAR